LAMMNEALKQVEEEEVKRKADEKAASQAVPTGAPTGKKPDPKAAAAAKGGKAPAKGAPVVEDVNSPKDITIDYPECPTLPDYVVIDRTYKQMKANANPVEVVQKGTDPNMDKRALRLAQLQDAYEIIRGKSVCVATVVRLNYVEPPPPVVEERVPTPEPTKPAKGGAAKKK